MDSAELIRKVLGRPESLEEIRDCINVQGEVFNPTIAAALLLNKLLLTGSEDEETLCLVESLLETERAKDRLILLLSKKFKAEFPDSKVDWYARGSEMKEMCPALLEIFP